MRHLAMRHPLLPVVLLLSCTDDPTPSTGTTTDPMEGSSSSIGDDTGQNDSRTSGPTTTTTGPGSSDGDSSSTGDGSSDGTSGSSGAVDSCGDGIVQAPEDCDDGNQVYGDGCSACAVSGTELWTVEYQVESVDPFGIDVDQADGIVLVGAEAGVMTLQGLVQRYSSDGALDGATTIPSPGPWVYSVARAPCTGTGDRVYVAGSIDDVQGGPATRHLRAYDGLGLAWAVDSAPGDLEDWSNCVVVDDGPVVVGFDLPSLPGVSGGIATAFDADGDEIWSYARDDGGFVDVAPTPTGELVVLASSVNTTIVWLGADGMELETRSYPSYAPSRIAVDDSGSIYLLALAPEELPWLAKLDADGNVLWTANPYDRFDELEEGSYLRALALGPNGEAIVGGDVIEGGPYLPWITVYSSDGAPLSSAYLDMPLAEGSPGDVRDLDVDGEGNLVIAVAAYDIALGGNVALLRKQVI